MMTYTKDGGEKFPVKDGQTWGGPGAQVTCVDLTNRAIVAPLLTSLMPTVAYLDPPWGQGNLTTFWGKAGRVAVGPGAVFQGVIGALGDYLAPLGIPTFMEMGVKWEHEAIAMLTRAGMSFAYSVGVTYYRKHPARLMVFNADGLALAVRGDLEGLDDEDTPSVALRGRQGLAVDLCTGRGLTAVTAYKLGLPFIGTELNSYRVSVTLTKLQALGLQVGLLRS